MEYKQYLKSNDWKTKRARKYKKPRRCAICASTENLDVHHLNYRNLFDVLQSDLRVLCRRCHYLAHDLHKQGKIKFKSTDHNSRFILIKIAVKKHLGLTGKNLFANGEGSRRPVLLKAKEKLNNAGHDRPTNGN